MKLKDKIAIVTGAGKGIGREAALAIAKEGALVVAVARTQSDLDETVRLIEDAGGRYIYPQNDSNTSVAVDMEEAYLLASEDTIEREFGVYDRVRDNFPKYVVTLDEFDMSRGGIKHRNIRDFLLQKEWT